MTRLYQPNETHLKYSQTLMTSKLYIWKLKLKFIETKSYSTKKIVNISKSRKHRTGNKNSYNIKTKIMVFFINWYVNSNDHII